MDRVENLKACNVCNHMTLYGHHGFKGLCEIDNIIINYSTYSQAKNCPYFESDYVSCCNVCLRVNCQHINGGMAACSKIITK